MRVPNSATEQGKLEKAKIMNGISPRLEHKAP